MIALRKVTDDGLMGNPATLIGPAAVSNDNWAYDGVEQRRYGQLNISKTHANELSENLKFIEECLQEGFTGLALEVSEELNIAFKNSPSLLVKILLRELTDYLKSPSKISRQTLTLNTLNMMIVTRGQYLN